VDADDLIDPQASSTTPHGLPYPAPTDPVAQGAAAIQALATAVDARLGYQLIQELVLAAAGALSFTAIPAGFRALRVIFNAKGDTNAASTSHSLRLNNDSGSQNYGSTGGYASALGIGALPAATMPASYFASGELDIVYGAAALAPAGRHIGVHGFTIARIAAAGTGADFSLAAVSGVWLGNFAGAAVNRLDLIPGAGNYVAGSRAALYGLL
jgi:hypothetical protein